MKSITMSILALAIACQTQAQAASSQTFVCTDVVATATQKISGAQIFGMHIERLPNSSERDAVEVARSLQKSLCDEDKNSTVSISVFPEIDGYLVLGMIPR